MKKSAATQWILVILLFISYQFAFNAQTLDATFSSPSTTQCSGGLFTLNATTSSYQSYSWTISGPNAFTSNLSGSSTSLNLTEAGTYNVSLTVSDGVISETNTVNGYLNTLTPAIANAGVDQTVCANSSVTLNGSVNGPVTTISWSGGTGTFSPNMANLTSTYSPSPSEIATGFVNLTLTTNDPVGPCPADQDTVRIFFNSVPIVSAPSSMCVGSTAQLSPSSGGTWVSNNSLIATVSGNGLVTGVSPGIVSFSFTNAVTGCTNTSSSLTITSNATVNPVPNQVVCAGDSTTPITFTGSGQQYNWTNDNPFIGLTASGTGNIAAFIAINTTLINEVATITVTPISSGCNSTPTTFTITVKPRPTVFASLDQTVCHDDITIPVNFSGAINASVYNWIGSNNIGMLPLSGTGNIPAFPAFNGSQNIIVDSIIVTPSLNGCVGVSDTLLIIVKPVSTVFSVTDQTVCAGESTSPIAFSGSNLNTVYYWTLDNTSIGIVSSGTGNIPAFQAQNTTFNIQTTNIIVTPNLNGCTWVSDTFSITVNPLPIINVGNDITICYGATFTPVATGTAITISWNNGVVEGTSFIPTVTETYIATGTNMNCSNSDSITVIVNSVPQLTISSFDGEDSLACDGTLSANVTSGTAPYSYTWTNGAANYTTAAIQNLCSGSYSLDVVDANGCSAANSATINDTLIQNVLGDTLIFTDNIYQDSTIIGADTSAWIENCTFDYSLVTGATIDSYIDSGDSTIVTWIVALSTGSTVSVDATYYMSPGTTGVYDLTLQLYCSAKSGPKFLVASSRLYYEASTIGIETHSLNAIYLYPNPTKSTLSISGINSDFSYKISDLQGKLLKQGANEKQIDIEHLPTGTYVIGISTDSEVRQLRFVKL